jgi:hypothetical protein
MLLTPIRPRAADTDQTAPPAYRARHDARCRFGESITCNTLFTSAAPDQCQQMAP